jgi:hypothetical protein
MMLSENDLVNHLVSQFATRVVILYGSAANGALTETSDVDLVCFAESAARYPDSHVWRGFLLDIWIHPLEDAEKPEDFLKLHDGRVLLDENNMGRALMDAVIARISQPRKTLESREKQHRKAWIWKMYDRAVRGGIEGDYRRHWLLHDLVETWCDMTDRHFLGSARTFKRMQTESPATYVAIQAALKPTASTADIERAVSAVVGEKE